MLALVGVFAVGAAAACGSNGDGAGPSAGAGGATDLPEGGAGPRAAQGGAAGTSPDGTGGVPQGGGAGTSPRSSAPCQSDKDCRAADQLCDVNAYICVDCLTDSDCGEHQNCKQQQCVSFKPCDSTRDCPVDQVCDQVAKRCVECVGDNDCCAGSTDCKRACVASECKQTCVSDKDCRSLGRVCDLLVGYCVECTKREDCQEHDYCANQRCKPEVCAPGSALCNNNDVARCNADGSGFLAPIECSEEKPCSPSGEQAACGSVGEGGTAGMGGAGNAGTSGLGNGGTSGGGAVGGGLGGHAGSGGSSSTLTCSDPRLIDNMEDGDTTACRFAWSSLYGTGDRVKYSVSSIPAREGSHKALQVTVDINPPTDDYGGVRTTLAISPNAFDASGYKGIEFWARHASAETGELMVSVDEAPEYTNAGFEAKRTITNKWQRYEIRFSEFLDFLDKFEPAKMTLLEFWTTEDAVVLIDDIAFIQ